jgi:hypothetical protein
MSETVITLHPVWPILVAIIAAIGFGAIAVKARRSPISLSAAGGVASFLIGQITSGLANACAVPSTPWIRTRFQLFALVSTVALVGLAALLQTSSGNRSERASHSIGSAS